MISTIVLVDTSGLHLRSQDPEDTPHPPGRDYDFLCTLLTVVRLT
jgi:hypothetical protein